ncbi:MAG TPA: SDR family oxidoreductase [Myxococcales bacterium]|nr:SDR family oxidoreductase [Myxococcales bacterium]
METPQRPLEGKVVLVTGGGVRLGRAIAEAAGRAGASVAVHYHRSAAGAEEALRAIRADGNRAAAFRADLADPSAAEPLAAAVEAELGPISALVNSAALFERAPFTQTPLDVLERQWAVNARAPYLLTQAVARRMLARGAGDVVNVLDIGGVWLPWRQYSAYCMTKAAMAALTRCLALELAPAVRVNGVAPGAILPPESMDAAALEALRANVPQQRFGGPEDLARTVLFLLAGPAFITGQIIAVDGGRTLGNARAPV